MLISGLILLDEKIMKKKKRNMKAQDFIIKDDIENNHNYLGHPTDRYYYTEGYIAIFAERYHQARLKLLGIADDFMAVNGNDSIKTSWDIRECFKQLRTSKDNGDIRLTIAQQEEICDLVERFYEFR